MKNIKIDGPCNTDCPRFCSGTCSYDLHDKEEQCPLWKAEIKKIQYIIDAIESLNQTCSQNKELPAQYSFRFTFEDLSLILHVEKEDYSVQVKYSIRRCITMKEDDESKRTLIVLLGQQLIDFIINALHHD